MPLGPASEYPPPPRGHWKRPDEGSDGWAIPIGRFRATQFFLSSALLVAAAIIVGVVSVMSGRPGNNADLPMVALIGTGFWVAGWIAQALAQLSTTSLFGLRLRTMTINLIGVESKPRTWSAKQTLLVSLSSLATLIFCGVFFWWADGGFQRPVLSRPQLPIWAPPNIGLSSSDSVWRVGAWLFWVQAVCQMFPLPNATGRHILAALTSICSRRLDTYQQVAVFRTCLVAMSLVTMLIGFWLFMDKSDNSNAVTPSWALVMLLAVLLWISSRAGDLSEMIIGFQPMASDSDEEMIRVDRLQRVMSDDEPAPGLLVRVRDAVQRRQDQRRVKRAMAQEKREAVDASRLDEILRQLHEQGPESLSSEDRAILDRVSQSLKKRRSEPPDASQQNDSP